QQTVRSELVTVPHHRYHNQTRRPAILGLRPTVECGIDEWLERDPSCRFPQQGQDATPIGWIQPNHSVSPPDRTLPGSVADGPSAIGSLRCVRGLGNNVGNSECVGNCRTEPIRSFVIEVIGEPQLRCGSQLLSAAVEEAFGQARAEGSQPSLAPLVAVPVVT